MSCCIPGCCNRQVQWTTPLPRDDLLLARWNAAIRAGTGRSIAEAQICNAHFASNGKSDYLEPTLFYRNNVQLQVAWCRLCLRHDSVENMFEVNEPQANGNRSLAWMANKHFGVWLQHEKSTEHQYFCVKCKVRLEATNGFWQEIQEAAEQYQILCKKMSVQNIAFQKHEPKNSLTKVRDDHKVEDESKYEFPAITDDELEEEVLPTKKQILSSSLSKTDIKIFAVVEIVESSITKIVTVPTSWLKEDSLMWPKQVYGEMLDKMRKDGFLLDDSVEYEEIPVVVLQKFEQFHTAEAAAQDILRSRNREHPPTSSSALAQTVSKETLTYKLFRNEIHNLKQDLNTLVQTAVEAAAERSFRKNFNRFSSVLGDPSSKPVNSTRLDLLAEEETEIAQKHNKISNEDELDIWNAQLKDTLLCQTYLDYFSKIIFPHSCPGKGDNALYTIVDYLFTRDFWNHFTWTGISRGQKSDRGFREFSNVTNLLLDIVRLGDSTYDAAKLETFCRARLFRYCKARSARQQLRRSACRPRKKLASGDSRCPVSETEVKLETSVTDDGCSEQSVICKIEDIWRQSEDTNPDQNSDSMM